jgi:type II secretory pathway pseudopilin PulG
MDRKAYKAFTLIEMLIVMGILIILMVVGVAAGRFAINRANEIANRNGATQLYQALQGHYTDYGKYPAVDTNGSFADVVNGDSGENTIGQYLDMGSFGGKEATYVYLPNSERQSLLICVTLGGTGDSGQKGIVCAGNGFGDGDISLGGVSPLDSAEGLNVDKLEYGSAEYNAVGADGVGYRANFVQGAFTAGSTGDLGAGN